jgi:hypothetical protein
VEEKATTTKTNRRVLAKAQTFRESESALTGDGPTAGTVFGIQTTAIVPRVHATVAGSPESLRRFIGIKEDAPRSLVGMRRILAFGEDKRRFHAKTRRKEKPKALRKTSAALCAFGFSLLRALCVKNYSRHPNLTISFLNLLCPCNNLKYFVS